MNSILIKKRLEFNFKFQFYNKVLYLQIVYSINVEGGEGIDENGYCTNTAVEFIVSADYPKVSPNRISYVY